MGRRSLNKIRSSDLEKRKKWINNAMPYFQEYGIREINMEKMAEYLGISKGTIYNHFSSKDEIVEFAVRLKIDSIKDFHKILFNYQLGFVERYYKSIQYYTQQLYDISLLIIDDLKELYPEVWALVNNFQDAAMKGLIRYYEEGMASGNFIKVNPKLLAREDRLFFELLFNQSFLIKNNLTLRKAFNDHFKVKFNGLIESKIPFELE
ncbi:MAG: TetR/AcrR family transcriptional regulator [Flavobacteriales bacterium]|nr:TetR/AcrR family transcriptional regulator [Flavobacteriales bacterium]